MTLDFIEIGTSDFRTLAENPDLKGISIEPVTEYFLRLPNRSGLIKINAAISNTDSGIAIMHFCRSEVIKDQKLPGWLRGCNSIHDPHPSVVQWCADNGVDYDQLVGRQEINMITLDQLFLEYEVTEVDFLKVDTEGHDYQIMKSFFQSEYKPEIRKIQFESNALMSTSKKKELHQLARDHGYLVETVITRGNEDTILTK